jgi:ubiquinone/menaquinone biosynthesis C-methylase UbiE
MKGNVAHMKRSKVHPEKKSKKIKRLLIKLLYNPKRILRRYVKKDMTVLDIGCGPGLFSFEMAKIGARVIAADLQQEMLDKLRNKIEGLSVEKNIKLVKCEEKSINVSEKVDFALAFYVIHEVSDQKKILGQIKNALNPEGKFLLTEPLLEVSANDFEKILELAEEQGFKIIENPKVSMSRTALLQALK